MKNIPQERGFDSTLAMLQDPYRYISKRCKQYETDILQTRLLLQDAILMSGSQMTELFYDTDHFIREDAIPGRIQRALFGKGGVQGLNGAPHAHRKQMLMNIMSNESVMRLVQMTKEQWEACADEQWKTAEQVVLYDEMQQILCRSVCEWAGIPVREDEIPQRTEEITAQFIHAASVGFSYWWARLARVRAERWLKQKIQDVRDKQHNVSPQSAIHIIATYRDTDGELLDLHTAAVELLNVVRPSVAVSTFITFIAHALNQYPELKLQLTTGDDDYLEWFVQEIRRFYPFFPAVAARTRCKFEFDGYTFPEDTRVLLDIYGTNRDERTWDDPGAFMPTRFDTWDGSRFNFIPQGGGDYIANHRCAGELLTIELMKAATTFLNSKIQYDVPDQDVQLDYSKAPALPKSGFIISNITTN